MNVILLLFIVLSATLLASSINNLLTVSNAISYFGKITNISDYFIVAYENEEITKWAQKCDYIKEFDIDHMIVGSSDKLFVNEKKLDINGTPFITTVPQERDIVVNKDNEAITKIGDGEVGICYSIAEKAGLKIGDEITFQVKDFKQSLKLKYIFKDSVFGSEYMGMKRLIVSDGEYEKLSKVENADKISLYGITSDDTKALEKDLNQYNYNIVSTFSLDMLGSVYTLDMIVAAILAIVSMVLITISLVILRFTIVFTVQEDYKEIGIMKAIGIKNNKIRGIYLIKYFIISVIGATIGIFLSFIASEKMLENISGKMAIENATANLLFNVLSGIFIILLVIVFCYLCTGKLNKFSAMQAIRSGSMGERFRKKTLISLHKIKGMNTCFYLALNDILSNFKRYVVLVITFILGTILVIIPMNVANTLNDISILKLFDSTISDVYINDQKSNTYHANKDLDEMLQDLENLENQYKEVGVDVDLYRGYSVYANVYKDDILEGIKIFASITKKCDAANFSYISGTAPELENEIAMTEVTMDALGVTIGDTVQIMLGQEKKSYIITASYQTMNNMGQGLRFSENADVDLKYAIGFGDIQGNFAKGTDKEKAIKILRETTPGYEIKTTETYIDNFLGSITNTIDSIKTMIIILVLVVNGLITVLLVKTFLAKDVGEIALLMNLGYSNMAIRFWQTLRISIVLFMSIVLGALISKPLNNPISQMAFGTMGATQIDVKINAIETYLMYPAILFLFTSIIAFVCTSGIRKISFREINNIE